jgi:hypothetical protein
MTLFLRFLKNILLKLFSHNRANSKLNIAYSLGVPVVFSTCFNCIVNTVKLVFTFVSDVILHSEASEAVELIRDSTKTSNEFLTNMENFKNDLVELEEMHSMLDSALSLEESTLREFESKLDILGNNIENEHKLLDMLTAERKDLLERSNLSSSEYSNLKESIENTLGINYSNRDIYNFLIVGDYRVTSTEKLNLLHDNDSETSNRIRRKFFKSIDSKFAKSISYRDMTFTDIYFKKPSIDSMNLPEYIEHRKRLFQFRSWNPELYHKLHTYNSTVREFLLEERKRDIRMYIILQETQFNLAEKKFKYENLRDQLNDVSYSIEKKEKDLYVTKQQLGVIEKDMEIQRVKRDRISYDLEKIQAITGKCKEDMSISREHYIESKSFQVYAENWYDRCKGDSISTRCGKWAVKYGVKEMIRSLFRKPPGNEPPFSGFPSGTPSAPVVTVPLISHNMVKVILCILIKFVIYFFLTNLSLGVVDLFILLLMVVKKTVFLV